MTTALASIDEPERLKTEALSWPERARELDVADDESYEYASATILAIKELRQQIAAHYAPLKKATDDAHKKVCAAEREMLAPLVEADRLIAPKLSAYLARKEQERRIEEARLREEQRKRDEEARLAAA